MESLKGARIRGVPSRIILGVEERNVRVVAPRQCAGAAVQSHSAPRKCFQSLEDFRPSNVNVLFIEALTGRIDCLDDMGMHAMRKLSWRATDLHDEDSAAIVRLTEVQIGSKRRARIARWSKSKYS